MILRFLFILSIVIFSPFAGIGNDSLAKHRDSLNTLLEIVSDDLKPRIYLQLSELVLPSDTNQALSFAYQALNLADKFQTEPDQIGSLNQLSTIFYLKGQVEKSLELSHQAMVILHTYAEDARPDANLDALEGKCLYSKARAYKSLFPDSIKVITDDLTIAIEKLKNTKEYTSLADAYKMLGVQYFEIDLENKGIENCKTALGIYRLLDDKEEMAFMYGRMSYETDRVTAIEYIQNAIDLYTQVNDSLSMARYFVALAYFTRTILDTETILGYLDLACNIYEKHDNYQELVYCLFHQQRYYDDFLNEPETTPKYLLRAAEICKEHQIIKRAGHVYVSLGKYYNTTNDYTLADYYLKLADTVTSFYPRGAARMRYYLELGKYYLYLKRYEEAEKAMLKGFEMARERKDIQLLDIAYFDLYLLYKEKGDFEQSLFYFQKKKALQDSTLNKHTERLVSEMQIKFETEKKEHALEIMKKNDQLKNVLLVRRRNTIYAVSAGLLAVLVLLSMLSLQYQKKRSAYAQLMKKNLELIKKEEWSRKDKSQVALNNHLDPNIHQQIMRKLSYQIKHNKIFLQNDLSLNSLAKKCHTNSAYLSRAINTEYQSNFSGFVNSLRIKEAQKIMATPQYSTYSVEGISESVGFKSKSVFNAAFKKYTGVTPSYYLEYLIENQQAVP